MQDANMKKAPSVRELSEKRTEGEKLALFKTLDKGNALSPTRFATSPRTAGSHPPRGGRIIKKQPTGNELHPIC